MMLIWSQDGDRGSFEVRDVGVYEHTPKSGQEADEGIRLNTN